MTLLWLVLYYVCFGYFALLFIRVVLQLIQQFSPQWRPSGIAAVIFEAVFTVTDPPLKAVGRVIPPLRLGAVMLDVAFLIVMLVTIVLMNLFASLHERAALALAAMSAF